MGLPSEPLFSFHDLCLSRLARLRQSRVPSRGVPASTLVECIHATGCLCPLANRRILSGLLVFDGGR